MCLSASANVTANRPFVLGSKPQTAPKMDSDLLKKKEDQPQTPNPFDMSPEEIGAKMATYANPVQSAPAETLGTMAYSSGGAEAAGTMASAGGSVSSVSCVA